MILFSPRRLWLECMTMHNNWESRGRCELDSRQPITPSNLDYKGYMTQ
jgi:hypothetical protein